MQSDWKIINEGSWNFYHRFKEMFSVQSIKESTAVDNGNKCFQKRLTDQLADFVLFAVKMFP